MASPVKDAKAKHEASGFSEIAERGKGYLKSKKPGTEQYALTTQIGKRGWHFGTGPFDESHEVDTAWVQDLTTRPPWRYKMVLADYNAFAFREATLGFNQGQLIEYVHPGSGEAINFQPTQLQWSNDLGQIEPIADPQSVSATVVDDTLLWTGAYGSGLDFRWQTQTARLFKALDINSLSDLGAPPQFIIDGGNPYLRLELLFQKSGAVDILVDGVLWDEKVNNPKTTANVIEFRLASTQETLWYFRQPLVWGNGGDENNQISPLMHVRKSAINLFVQIRVPWTWLESAVYPVIVDATVVDEQVGAGNSDAEEKTNNSNFAVGYTSINIRSHATNSYAGGFHFSGVAIEGTIDTAYIETYFYNASVDQPLADVYANDVDSAADFNTEADVAGRILTTATVAWGDGSDLGVGWWGSTVEIKTVVQEIVDRGSWASDNDIVIIIWARNTATHDANARSYEGNSSQAAKLHVEYTAGGATRRIFITSS